MNSLVTLSQFKPFYHYYTLSLLLQNILLSPLFIELYFLFVGSNTFITDPLMVFNFIVTILCQFVNRFFSCVCTGKYKLFFISRSSGRRHDFLHWHGSGDFVFPIFFNVGVAPSIPHFPEISSLVSSLLYVGSWPHLWSLLKVLEL